VLGLIQGTSITLQVQLGRLDRDGDGHYSRDEFMAANLSNLVLRDILGTAYRAHEASLPRPAAITEVPPGGHVRPLITIRPPVGMARSRRRCFVLEPDPRPAVLHPERPP
jgi:hypothetical protein